LFDRESSFRYCSHELQRIIASYASAEAQPSAVEIVGVVKLELLHSRQVKLRQFEVQLDELVEPFSVSAVKL